jgi:hypothetical protein
VDLSKDITKIDRVANGILCS